MRYSDVLLLGDFNENLLTRDSMGNCMKCVRGLCSVCRFSTSLSKFGFKSIGEAPTNFDGEPSLIDLILSNRPENFSLFNQIGSRLSNHDIVFATYNSPGITLGQKLQFWRNYKSVEVGGCDE